MRNESLNPESVPSGLEQFVPPTTPATSSHADGTLVDKYGRHITYIRLSITDRCDFRCFYCMAEGCLQAFVRRSAGYRLSSG